MDENGEVYFLIPHTVSSFLALRCPSKCSITPFPERVWWEKMKLILCVCVEIKFNEEKQGKTAKTQGKK